MFLFLPSHHDQDHWIISLPDSPLCVSLPGEWMNVLYVFLTTMRLKSQHLILVVISPQ